MDNISAFDDQKLKSKINFGMCIEKSKSKSDSYKNTPKL